MDLPLLHLTLPELVRTIGYLGVFVIVFVESGLPIGVVIPLPGDTLLFSAGILAGTGAFNLLPLMITIGLAAILGDSAGYWFGKKFGPKLFSKEDAWFMSKHNLTRTEEFYKKYGMRAIIFARFLPLFRTIVPIFAGVARMDYNSFLRYNIAGAAIWTITVTMLGYYLGSVIPDVDKYLLPALLIIIVVTSLSTVREILKVRGERNTPTAE